MKIIRLIDVPYDPEKLIPDQRTFFTQAAAEVWTAKYGTRPPTVSALDKGSDLSRQYNLGYEEGRARQPAKGSATPEGQEGDATDQKIERLLLKVAVEDGYVKPPPFSEVMKQIRAANPSGSCLICGRNRPFVIFHATCADCGVCKHCRDAAEAALEGTRPEGPTDGEMLQASFDGNRPLPFDRDTLGQHVRDAWIRWAKTQPNPKPSWLVPYDQLSEPDKEADRQIGEHIARLTLVGDAASRSVAADAPCRAAAMKGEGK